MSTGVLETCIEKWNKYIRKKRIVRQVGYLQELNRDARSTKHKKAALLLCLDLKLYNVLILRQV